MESLIDTNQFVAGTIQLIGYTFLSWRGRDLRSSDFLIETDHRADYLHLGKEKYNLGTDNKNIANKV